MSTTDEGTHYYGDGCDTEHGRKVMSDPDFGIDLAAARETEPVVPSADEVPVVPSADDEPVVPSADDGPVAGRAGDLDRAAD